MSEKDRFTTEWAVMSPGWQLHRGPFEEEETARHWVEDTNAQMARPIFKVARRTCTRWEQACEAVDARPAVKGEWGGGLRRCTKPSHAPDEDHAWGKWVYVLLSSADAEANGG